jgi:hypothetical protein
MSKAFGFDGRPGNVTIYLASTMIRGTAVAIRTSATGSGGPPR